MAGESKYISPIGEALSKSDDTNVTLTLSGSPTTSLLNATSLTLGWTGTLAQSRGGTSASNGGNLLITSTTNYHTSTSLTNLSATSNNIAIGDEAGLYIVNGNNNILLGYRAGYDGTQIGTGDSNIMLGYEAGYYVGLNHNIMIGYRSGYDSFGVGSASYNVIMGYEAGYNVASSYNVILGYQSIRTGLSELGGIGNVTIGYQSAYQAEGTFANNVSIGYKSAYSQTTGTNGVYIGYEAGYQETSSNRLYISNHSGNTNQSLIYGEFDTPTVRINSKLEINTTVGIELKDGNNIMGYLGYSESVGGLIGNKGFQFHAETGDTSLFFVLSTGSGLGHETFIRAIMTPSGKLGLSNDVSPSYFLDINRTSENADLRVKSTFGTAYVIIDSKGDDSDAMIQFLSGGTTKYVIGRDATDGNFKLGTTSLETGTVINIGSTNYSIGNGAGNDISSGTYNINIGYGAGTGVTSSSYNVFIGNTAGKYSNGGDNIAIGAGAMLSFSDLSQTGSYNIVIGEGTARSLVESDYNIFIGDSSAGNSSNHIHGGYNVGVGVSTLYDISGGTDNIAIGSLAGNNILNGTTNTVLGSEAGQSIINSSGNVFIGYHAGTKETGSNKLFISNFTTNNEINDRINSLVYGEFDNKIFRINGVLSTTGSGSTTYESQFRGLTYSSSTPSLTEYPNYGDWGIHENQTGYNYYLAFSDGSTIYSVQLT